MSVTNLQYSFTIDLTMQRPIKSVIAYLQQKKCKTLSGDEDILQKENKISALKETLNKKERTPLMNRFQNQCSELFSKITVLEEFIIMLQGQIKQLNGSFSKVYKQMMRQQKQHSMISTMKDCSKKIEGILVDLRHKSGTIYSIQDSKEKLSEHIRTISVRVDKADVLQRKVVKLQNSNHLTFQGNSQAQQQAQNSLIDHKIKSYAKRRLSIRY